MSSENLYNKIDRRVTTVEEAVRLLTDLALRADERMDGLEAAQTNSEVKIAALANALIRLEAAQENSEARMAALADAHVRLEAAQENSEARMVALAESQIRTDSRLHSLIDIVREGRSDSQ